MNMIVLLIERSFLAVIGTYFILKGCLNLLFPPLDFPLDPFICWFFIVLGLLALCGIFSKVIAVIALGAIFARALNRAIEQPIIYDTFSILVLSAMVIAFLLFIVAVHRVFFAKEDQ